MSLILNQSEAQAVFAAMQALNAVGGEIKATIPDAHVQGCEARIFNLRGSIRVAVVIDHELMQHEDYASQAAFAEAYEVK